MIHKHSEVSLPLHANYPLAAQQEHQRHPEHNRKCGTELKDTVTSSQPSALMDIYTGSCSLRGASASLGDHFLAWQVEPHLPSCSRGG